MSRESTESCQNRRNNLKEGIEKIYKSEEFHDATFTVGRKTFKVHKLILAARCSEFARILMAPNAVNDNIVEDESVTEIGFEILLRFIYTDNLGTDDKLSIVQAFLAADYYGQKKLKEKCEELMQSWSLTVSEVCELLNVCLRIAKLRMKCLDFIKKNTSKVISSPNFLKLSYPAMIAILENDALKNVELVERITKVIDWGVKIQRNPGDLKAVREYLLNTEPPLLGKLKIEELQVQELAQLFTFKYKGLLTPDEITNFMTYTHVKDKSTLPKWCTSA